MLRLNGAPVAQLALSPTAFQGDVEVSLPVETFKAGYNDLEFFVAQHVDEECVDPTAGDLWTTLMLDRAEIDFDYTLRPVPLSLASLDSFLFDSRLSAHPEVVFLLQDTNPTTLQAAALAASGVALRMDYQPVRFRLETAPIPDRDHVVVGDRAFVESVTAYRMEEGDNAALAVSHLLLPARPSTDSNATTQESLIDTAHAMITVCGNNAEAMLQAATALSLRNYPLPQSAAALIKKIEIPELEPYTAKMMLQPGNAYKLSALDFSTHTFSGSRAAGRVINFRLASDLLFKPQKNAELEMKLSYGSRMREDSVLNVFVNETFVGAIALDDPEGGRFTGYKIQIPAYVLKNGFNTLTFSSALTPSETGRCEYIQEKNLHVTVYDDSVLTLPSLDHFTELPALTPIMQDGFPYGIWADLRSTEIRLPDANPANVSAALNTVALLAQKSGVPPLGLGFAIGAQTNPQRHGIMLGAWDTLPDTIRQGTKLEDKAPALFTEFRTPEVKTEGFVNQLQARYFPQTLPPAIKPDPNPAWIYQDQHLGRGNMLLAQFPTPGASGDKPSMTWLLTAIDSKDLLAGSITLWEPAVQGRISGDTCLIRLKGDESEVWPVNIQSRMYLGQVGIDLGLSAWLLGHPWISLLATAGLFVVFIISMRFLLQRFRRQRLHNES
ncbi:MAG: hypothetical protein EOM37_13960 [Proteobacteria bacterium]|nr:hypothetical protein [Pseudomonadota bacterium]